MFMLQAETSQEFVRYLQQNKEYSVGRKDADILILNDQSISRKHAILHVHADHITVTDCGSTYHTYVDNVKIEGKKPVIAKSEAVIQFGGLQSKFRLKKSVNLVCCSGINNAQKEQLVKKLSQIESKLTSKWSKSCTHMTVEKLKLTPKVLCAIIENQFIVSLKYWDDYVKAVQSNATLPNPSDYSPELEEITINQAVDLSYNPRRKTLFKNKIFVMLDERLHAEMREFFTLAGGDCVLFSNLKKTKEEVLNAPQEYIFIQMTTNTQQSDDFEKMVSFMREHNRFSIPISDVGYAIAYCTCEKHANSYFNKSSNFLAKNPAPVTQVQLAPETQTQIEDSQISPVKEELVVPETQQMDVQNVEDRRRSLAKNPFLAKNFNVPAKTTKRTVEFTQPKPKKVKVETQTSNSGKTISFGTPNTNKPDNKKFNPFSKEALQIQKRPATELENTSKKVCFGSSSINSPRDRANPFTSIMLTQKANQRANLEEITNKIVKKPFSRFNESYTIKTLTAGEIESWKNRSIPKMDESILLDSLGEEPKKYLQNMHQIECTEPALRRRPRVKVEPTPLNSSQIDKKTFKKAFLQTPRKTSATKIFESC